MRHVTHSTTDIKELVHQPVGSVAYFELEPGAPASRVQNLIAGRARTARVRLKTRTMLLLDTEEITATKVIRAEVMDAPVAD